MICPVKKVFEASQTLFIAAIGRSSFLVFFSNQTKHIVLLSNFVSQKTQNQKLRSQTTVEIYQPSHMKNQNTKKLSLSFFSFSSFFLSNQTTHRLKIQIIKKGHIVDL